MRELVVSAPAGAINLHLRRARPHLRRAGLRLAPLLSTATNKQSPANFFLHPAWSGDLRSRRLSKVQANKVTIELTGS